MSKCNLIRDLLPLVAEEMASEETKTFVQKHIAFCPGCAAELAHMQKSAQPIGELPALPLRAVRRELIRRRALIVVLTALIAMCIVLPAVSLMTRPIYKPFDEDAVYVSSKNPGGQAYIDSVLMLDVQNAGWYWAEDADGGEAALYVYAYDTLYDTLMGKKIMVTFSQRQWPEGVPVTRVYYQQNNGQENVLLFREEMRPDAVRRLADAIAQKAGGLTAVFAGSGDQFAYALIRADGADINPFVKAMNAALNGRGGGRSGFAQGSLRAERAAIEAFFAAHR